MVLFLELAAALSMSIAAALYPATQQKPVERPAVVGAKPETPVRDEKSGHSDEDQTPPKGRPGRRPTVLPTEAVERLRQRGGKVAASVNGVGKLMGAKSKTTAHRFLHQLASAGLIRMDVGPHGVAVALI
jgi:hypothetical protein